MSDDCNDDAPGDKPPTAPGSPGGEETVGYGRPPVGHRFKKGQSGNPKGRPKGARGLKSEIAEVLNETFPVAGSRKRVTTRKAVLLKQREKAIKSGDARAASLLLGFAQSLEDEEAARASQAETEARDEHDRALIEAALLRLIKPDADRER
jgi:hypothetical protein